jgi:hypothetical protein
MVPSRRGSGLLLDAQQFRAATGQAFTAGDQSAEMMLTLSLPGEISVRLLRPTAARARSFVLVEDEPDVRGVVVTLETGGLQLVLVVPLLFELSRTWLLEGVELRRRFSLAIRAQGHSSIDLLRIEHPVAQPEDAPWKAVRARVASSPPDGLHLGQLMQVARLLRHVEHDRTSLQEAPLTERWVIAFAPERRGPQRLHEQARGSEVIRMHSWGCLVVP